MLKQYFIKKDLGLNFSMALSATLVINLVMSFVAQIFGIPYENYAFRWVFTAVNTLAIGAMAFVCCAISKTNPVTALKLKVKPSLAHVGWGCLATLFLITCMIPLNGWISELIVSLGLPNPSVNINFDVASMIVLACVLPAFCEEIVFRGAVAGALENNKNKLASLAIAGALFSVFHMNPAQTVHQFVLGAFLALLLFRSGSVWTCVIVHFVNNLFVVVLDAVFGKQAEEFFANNAIWLFFVGLACFVACVVGYLFTTKSNWNKSSNEEEAKYGVNCLVLLFIAVGICLAVWIATLFVPTNEGSDVVTMAQFVGKGAL